MKKTRILSLHKEADIKLKRKMFIKKISLITVILFAISVSAYSQIGVTSYSINSLGIISKKEFN